MPGEWMWNDAWVMVEGGRVLCVGSVGGSEVLGDTDACLRPAGVERPAAIPYQHYVLG